MRLQLYNCVPSLVPVSDVNVFELLSSSLSRDIASLNHTAQHYSTIKK